MKKFHEYTITLSDTFKIRATSESEARAEALQLYAEKYKPRDWVWDRLPTMEVLANLEALDI
tara:strand:+ start:1274 stop:1459 length:186 start_codon:yes stop_codon:yes gene_type:complete